MLYFTEANREQVTAIRKIQGILDRMENRQKTDIIFEKFRQTLPLQIGLSNGKDVLNLLERIRNESKSKLSEKTNELHHAEEALDIMHEELAFLEKE